ncbi:MAG: hypothetical protein JZU47_15865 [Prolixibacteraceae bacterium]|nr:hypothetical protein [Prolixibacteraceae bacterium]
MKKTFIFLLLIASFFLSCKENTQVTDTLNQFSGIGSNLYLGSHNFPDFELDTIKISTTLNKLVESENNPGRLIETAFAVKTYRPFGDTLSVIAANFLLQKAANLIEDFNFSSNIFKALTYRRLATVLQEEGVPVNIPISRFRKIMTNIQQKNFNYLFKRLQLQVVLTVSQTSFKVFYTLFGFLSLIFIVNQIKRRRYFFPMLIILSTTGVFIIYGMAPQSANTPKISLQSTMFDFQIENEMGTVQILNEKHIPIGKLIYVNENMVGFGYHFSPQNISSIIDSISKINQLLLNTTASFVNNKIDPVGFNAVNGDILNPMFNYHWDGLVLLEDKKIDILSLKNEKTTSLTTSFESYFQLTIRVKNNHSSAFQVPLLIYNDSLMLNPENVPLNSRESRFLIKVVTPQKKGYYLLVDIDNYYPLAYNTLAILNRFRADHYSVNFMVLLDVGANNYFQVYNPDGTKNNHFISTLPSDKASNILSIFFLRNSTFTFEL